MTNWTLKDFLWFVGTIIYEAFFVGLVHYVAQNLCVSVPCGIVLGFVVAGVCVKR